MKLIRGKEGRGDIRWTERQKFHFGGIVMLCTKHVGTAVIAAAAIPH